MTPPLRPSVDELLAHAGWMRTLARGLLADPESAEELVQDTWVVALRERTRVRVDLGAWLRSVVRNLARQRGRRESGRRPVEQRAARPEAQEGAHEALERMELQRWLAEALLALEEPARSAVILRHVEGLDAGEIARRQGCTAPAARQRVARGLARLREALDRRPGGARAWIALLAPLAGMPVGTVPQHWPPPVGSAGAPSPALPWILGGIAVSTKLVVASSLGVASLLAVLWLVAGRSGTPRGNAASAPAPPLRTALEVPPSEVPPESPRAPVRLAHGTPPPVPPADGSTPVDPLLAVLSGRVIDEDGAPVAGARVVVQRPILGNFSVLDLALRRAPREVGRTTTGTDGRFAFELERGIPVDLAAEAAGFCDEHLARRVPGDELEIVLAQGFLARGRVTRARDGAPIVDARVRVFQLGGKGSSERVTRTDADGRYELRFTIPADAMLEVTPLVEMSSDWIQLEPGPDGTVEQDVELGDGVRVVGRVVEAGTGRPLAEAEVGEGWTFRRSAFTDATGTYRLDGFGAEGSQELYARAPGHGSAQLASLPPAKDGEMRVDFELAPGNTARGRVVDPAGRGIPEAYVGAVASEDGPEGQRTDWVSGRTDGRGLFELAGLSPGLHHALVVSHEGHATLVLDFPERELQEPEIELGEIVLAPPAFLAGRVEDEHGEPRPDVEVILTGTNADRARLRADPSLPPAGDWYVDSRSGRTDARGRFAFGALPAGEFRLLARRRGQPESPRLRVQLAQGEVHDDLVLVYPRGESIRGKVVDGEGRGLGGVYVILDLARPREAAVQAGTRRQDASTRTGSSGTFELTGLIPGDYHLDFRPFEVENDPDFPWLATRIESVPSGGEPLRVELPRGVTIRGRLTDADGAPLVGYSILGSCVRGGPADLGTSGATDDQGRFTLAVHPGTVWDLEVRGAPQTEGWDTVLLERPGVAAGDPEVLLGLERDPRR